MDPRRRSPGTQAPAGRARLSKSAAGLLGVILAVVATIGSLILVEQARQAHERRSAPPGPNERIDGNTYAGGHQVRGNRSGFRDRGRAAAKAPGVLRIMVLGDSLTWGAGLAVEERYTDRLEALLMRSLSSGPVEVLNFGRSGASTVMEHDVLRRHAERFRADLIVLGFWVNDPQPRSQDWSVERAAFDQGFGRILDDLRVNARALGLARIGIAIRKGGYRVAEYPGIIPEWRLALERADEPGSAEWRNFVTALEGIKELSDSLGLPAPVFAVLNQGVQLDRPTDYSEPDDNLRI